MSYDFRDNPNKNFYPTRRGDIRMVVIHTAESLPDWSGADGGAEAVSRYGATTSRQVSWHATVDSDSVLTNLPDEYTAFHAKGVNSVSLGVEVATQAAKWGHAPPHWTANTIRNLAGLVAGWCKKHRIPVRRIRDPKLSGIIAHADVDPERRTDPGKDFPWELFLDEVLNILGNYHPEEDTMFITHDKTKTVWLLTGGVRVKLGSAAHADQLDVSWRSKLRVLAESHPVFRLPEA